MFLQHVLPSLPRACASSSPAAVTVRWCSGYFLITSGLQGKMQPVVIAAGETVIDRTVHVEHLLLQSHPKCFISHCPTYSVLSM